MTASGERSQLSTLITVDGWTVIQLAGDVDVALSHELAEAAKDAVALGLPVRIDLTEVTFMDSTGIGFLARLIAGGVRPQLVGASHWMIELVDVSGLASLLDLV